MSVAAVIGCGMVGASTAMRLGEARLCERLALVDVDEGLALATALDVGQALPAAGSDTRCAAGWDAVDGAGLVVVTAGRPRSPGQSRADLLEGNARIVADVCRQLRRRAPDAVVIVVTNPLDEMTALAQRVLGFPPERVVGMAGQLDTLRFRAAIADRLGVPPSSVEALTLGSHGETMVPLPRLARVGGRPLAELLPPAEVVAVVERTRDGGAEIVRLLRRGSAWWAPSAAILAMACAIVRDERAVLPVSALCRGELGIDGVYVGVPARLGAGGVREIVDPGLDAAERALLRAAADEVAARVADLDGLLPADEPGPSPPDDEAPVGALADLRLASQIRTAARAALAREGRLDRLDEVVEAALRRARP